MKNWTFDYARTRPGVEHVQSGNRRGTKMREPQKVEGPSLIFGETIELTNSGEMFVEERMSEYCGIGDRAYAEIVVSDERNGSLVCNLQLPTDDQLGPTLTLNPQQWRWK